MRSATAQFPANGSSSSQTWQRGYNTSRLASLRRLTS